MPLLLEDDGVCLSLQLGQRDDAGIQGEIALETPMGDLKFGDVFPWMESFLNKLSAFHRTLDGMVELYGYYGFSLKISHASRGQLLVEAIMDDPMVDNVRVEAKLRSDQSYIPHWVSSLRQDLKLLKKAS